MKEFPAPGPRPQGRGVAGSGRTVFPKNLQARLEDEVGDLFFVLVNIARYLSLDPESALRKTNRKFKRRFQWMEERLHESGRRPSRRRWKSSNRYGSRLRLTNETAEEKSV